MSLFFGVLCIALGLVTVVDVSRGNCYLQSVPNLMPPQQTSNATIKIRQVGLMLRLKLRILPPQQHKNKMMSKIQVQLQPPPQSVIPPPQPPLPPSLNNPLNIYIYLRYFCDDWLLPTPSGTIVYDQSLLYNMATHQKVLHIDICDFALMDGVML